MVSSLILGLWLACCFISESSKCPWLGHVAAGLTLKWHLFSAVVLCVLLEVDQLGSPEVTVVTLVGLDLLVDGSLVGLEARPVGCLEWTLVTAEGFQLEVNRVFVPQNVLLKECCFRAEVTLEVLNFLVYCICVDPQMVLP